MIQIENEQNYPSLISAKNLMLLLGILSFAFPILLVLNAAILDGCSLVQNSLSGYYHTVSRNIFVGVLCAIAFCLFAYRGYSSVDARLANLAAIFALGVAFFPTSVGPPYTDCLNSDIDTGTKAVLHYICASGLFLLLGIFSTFLFTRHKGALTKEKMIRNKIFRSCGIIIFSCIVLISIYTLYLKNESEVLDMMRPIYWLETIAIWAFAMSWLTKSGVLYKDSNS